MQIKYSKLNALASKTLGVSEGPILSGSKKISFAQGQNVGFSRFQGVNIFFHFLN